jgi:hypothetical protein
MEQGLRAIQEHLPPAMPTFDVLSQGQGGLLLIVLLCGLSVVLILLWLMAVWWYIRTAMLQRQWRPGD